MVRHLNHSCISYTTRSSILAFPRAKPLGQLVDKSVVDSIGVTTTNAVKTETQNNFRNNGIKEFENAILHVFMEFEK